MLCVKNVYVLPDVDVIILHFFKSATLVSSKVLPAKEKLSLPLMNKYIVSPWLDSESSLENFGRTITDIHFLNESNCNSANFLYKWIWSLALTVNVPSSSSPQKLKPAQWQISTMACSSGLDATKWPLMIQCGQSCGISGWVSQNSDESVKIQQKF